MEPPEVLSTLNRLLAVEHSLNDPDSPPVSIPTYFEELAKVGLTGKPHKAGPSYHRLRQGITAIETGQTTTTYPDESAEFARRQPEYEGMLGRIQTDNYMPPDWYMVRTSQGEVSAPGHLQGLLMGLPDTALPPKRRTTKTKRRSPTRKNPQATKRRKGATSLRSHQNRTSRNTQRRKAKFKDNRARGTAVSEKDKERQEYCPHMPATKGKHMKTTKTHKFSYKGRKYRFKTCCSSCARAIQANPAIYAKTLGKRDCIIGLRHREEGTVVQYAHEISSRCRRKRTVRR